ncbi:MAG: hypothetical protein HYU78_13890 [Rhodocyclales bacterium]|nr:hypothetical protein [Rhodocyclales bacterium]
MKTILAASFALSLVGCATQQVPIANDVASRINRVAVVSMTAKSFTRQHTGLTVFGNEKEEIDITDWKIDEQYEEQIRERLSSHFGLTAVAAPYPAPEFNRVNDLNGPWDAPAFWGPNWEAIESATKKYCTTNSLDAVVVLAKAKTDDFLSGTNQFFGGAGIYSRGPMGKTSMMHLLAKAALLDCATAKPLAIRPLAARQSGLHREIMRSSPLLPLDFEESRMSMQQWSPEQKLRMQTSLAKLPQQAIAETLRSMLPARTEPPGR